MSTLTTLTSKQKNEPQPSSIINKKRKPTTVEPINTIKKLQKVYEKQTISNKKNDINNSKNIHNEKLKNNNNDNEISFCIDQKLIGRKQDDAVSDAVEKVFKSLGFQTFKIFKQKQTPCIGFSLPQLNGKLIKYRISNGTNNRRYLNANWKKMIDENTSGIIALAHPIENSKYSQFVIKDREWVEKYEDNKGTWYPRYLCGKNDWKELSCLKNELLKMIQSGDKKCPSYLPSELCFEKQTFQLSPSVIKKWSKSKKDTYAVGQVGETSVAEWLRKLDFDVITGHESGPVDVACRHKSWKIDTFVPIQVKTTKRPMTVKGCAEAHFNIHGKNYDDQLLILLVIDSLADVTPNFNAGRSLVYVLPGSKMRENILSIYSQTAYKYQICGSTIYTDLKRIINECKDGQHGVLMTTSEEVKKAPTPTTAIESMRINVFRDLLQPIGVSIVVPEEGHQKFDLFVIIDKMKLKIKVQLKSARLTENKNRIHCDSHYQGDKGTPYDLKHDFDFMLHRLPKNDSKFSDNTWLVMDKTILLKLGIVSNLEDQKNGKTAFYFARKESKLPKYSWVYPHLYDLTSPSDLQRLKKCFITFITANS